MPMSLPANQPEPAGDLNRTIEAMVERAVRKQMMGMKPPDIKVTTPPVNVAAPNVTVNVPESEVEYPETVVNVDLSALTEQIKALRADVTALAAAMTKPVTRTVQRGGDGLIDKVTESRG